jgi:hypothetical protein
MRMSQADDQSVTPLRKSVTVRTGGRAVSTENSRLRRSGPNLINVTVGKRSLEYVTDRISTCVAEANAST